MHIGEEAASAINGVIDALRDEISGSAEDEFPHFFANGEPITSVKDVATYLGLDVKTAATITLGANTNRHVRREAETILGSRLVQLVAEPCTVETKGVRRVRTTAGERRFRLPIGTPIGRLGSGTTPGPGTNAIRAIWGRSGGAQTSPDQRMPHTPRFRSANINPAALRSAENSYLGSHGKKFAADDVPQHVRNSTTNVVASYHAMYGKNLNKVFAGYAYDDRSLGGKLKDKYDAYQYNSRAGRSVFVLNAKRWSNPDLVNADHAENDKHGWHSVKAQDVLRMRPDLTPEQAAMTIVANHEMGHVVHDAILNRSNGKDYDELAFAFAEKFEELSRSFGITDEDGNIVGDAIKAMVSEYATTNLNELWAEIWSAYQLADQVHPFVSKAGELMDRYFKQRIGR